MRSLGIVVPALLSVLVAGCSADSSARAEDDFSSNQATLLDFEFDAVLRTDKNSHWDDERTIQSQLLYTMGHLNHDNSVGRLDNLELSAIKTTELPGDKIEITYHAKLPVAWGSKTRLPKTYEFKLPKDISLDGQTLFTEKYKDACVDPGAHDLDTGNMWYYYRPFRQGCTVGEEDLVKTVATATRSSLNTTGKFPEYHKVWEDDRFEAVAIFGKATATGDFSDQGVMGFNEFVRLTQRELRAFSPVVTPEQLRPNPGPDTKDVTIEATLPDGKKVKVTALLVDAITSPWDGFDARYESLTPTADFISYNGHAGLGQNVRALARKGSWKAGKYQVFFMNGCDTFAYVDGSLAQARAELNPDDPTGTKYMEFVTNAMPSYFRSMPAASISIIKAMIEFKEPKTYDQIFKRIDRVEVVLVTGEEDNVFQPGMPIGSGK